MGVCDYQCFIARNDQNLLPLKLLENPNEDMEECDESGSHDVRVFKIPKSVASKEEINLWNLNKLLEFESVICKYDWDNITIDKFSGYDEIMINCDIDPCIWKSLDAPEYWLVNVDPVSFKYIVEDKVDPNLIPQYWYYEVMDNRNVEKESLSKEEMLKCIVDNYMNEH